MHYFTLQVADEPSVGMKILLAAEGEFVPNSLDDQVDLLLNLHFCTFSFTITSALTCTCSVHPSCCWDTCCAAPWSGRARLCQGIVFFVQYITRTRLDLVYILLNPSTFGLR